MLNAVPKSILEGINDQKGGLEFLDFNHCPGGCINHGGKLSTSKGDFFVKWNSTQKYPGMFEAEQKGLALLAKSGALRIPRTEIVGSDDEFSFILMEFVEQGARKPSFFEDMGVGLARLHRETNAEFGLDHNNYIGSLAQINTCHAIWSEYFITRRIEPQLRYGINHRKIDPTKISSFDILFSKLSSYFPMESPALLHGDLWSGNFITDEKGNPCLIDPAVYFGHREVDLAFTHLFGGFEPAFYRAYEAEFPLEPRFEERVDLYNLYPLLVHVNLFGGGYWNQVRAILRKFI